MPPCARTPQCTGAFFDVSAVTALAIRRTLTSLATSIELSPSSQSLSLTASLISVTVHIAAFLVAALATTALAALALAGVDAAPGVTLSPPTPQRRAVATHGGATAYSATGTRPAWAVRIARTARSRPPTSAPPRARAIP